MHPITLLAFQNELELLEKSANHGVELAGLGLLAAPSVAHMKGKEWSEKNKARAEVAGLGVLAAPSALAVGKAGLAKLKGAISKMPKHASRREDIDSIKDTRAGYTERSHRAGKAGSLLGAANALGAAGYASRNLKSAPKALGRIGGATVAGLAAGYGVGVGAHKAIYGHRKPKKKEAAPSMSAMMNMHRLADAAKAAKSTVKPLAQAATKLPNAAQQATRATQLAGHTAQGGHAWNAAAQAKRAIPL